MLVRESGHGLKSVITDKARSFIVYNIPLLARALGLKADRPSARATIGYLVYKVCC